MGGIQAAVRSVFGARGADIHPRAAISRPWPLFQLVSSHALDGREDDLSSIVEGEIIPRLIVAHGPSAIDPVAGQTPRAETSAYAAVQAAETFARLTLSRGADRLEAFFKEFIQRDVSIADVYAQLLAPAARLLIDLWSQDRLSYTEVTIALGRLQHLVRELDYVTPYNGDNDPSCRSAFFAPRPGEQQTFGFYIIEEQFRWSGWRTWIETSATNLEMNASVRCQWFDLFCLSVTREAHIDDVSETIASIRRASRNRDLFVLVNGCPFSENPELVDFVGADAGAANGDEALEIMDRTARRHAA